MAFGFDNKNLKKIESPFSHVNTCTTFLNTTGRLGGLKKCIRCQGSGLIARLGGTPLTCECVAARFK